MTAAWRAVGLFLLLITDDLPQRHLLGLGTWNGQYVLIGYLIPTAYCLVASLGSWLFGFGKFPNTEFVRQSADAFGLGEAPD
jgi:hypothetical protein